MTDPTAADKEAELRRCLQVLSSDEGVQRTDDDLEDLLKGDLAELCRTLRISHDHGVTTARKTIEASLHGLILQLTPRPARQKLTKDERKEQYVQAIAVSLYIWPWSELKNLKLQGRREWLAAKKRGLRRIAVTTSQRDLTHAIGQMARLLASPGYRPSKIEDTLSDWFGPVQPEPSSARPGTQIIPPPATRLILASLTGIVLLVAGAILVPSLIGGAADDSPQVGDALRFTILDMYGDPSSSFVFGASNNRESATFAQAQIGDVSNDYDAYINRALDSGAYFYRGIEVAVSVEGLKDDEATIYDVQVQKRDVQPVASDTAFIAPIGGRGPVIGMQFDLDQQHPIAMEIPEPSKNPRPLFDMQHPGLVKNQKVSLLIRASAHAAAYAFDFDVLYEYGGKKYRQNINRDGKPFRVSGPLCPGLLDKLDVPDNMKQRLAAQRYREVYGAALTPVSMGGPAWYSLGPAGPDKFATSCMNPDELLLER